MAITRIYVDTNVFKFSATRLLRGQPRQVRLPWGSTQVISTVYDLVYVNPNDGIKNMELRREAELLPQVAALAANEVASFVINVETKMEVWGLPSLDSETGDFYGAKVSSVDAPVQYGRIMFEANSDYKEEQFRFLSSIKHDRFRELQRITGAYQGERKLNRNQLLDAFHLWCAEHNKCHFFLTLDFTLAKIVAKSKAKPRVSVLKPSEVLTALKG